MKVVFMTAWPMSFPRMRGGPLTVETVELGFDVLPAYDVGDPEGSETV